MKSKHRRQVLKSEQIGKSVKPQPGRYLVIMLSIAIASVAVYVHVGSFGFTDFDDPAYVSRNTHVLGGITSENIRWAFRIDHTTGNWHPLTWISLMADTSLWGASARGYHTINVVLHVASAVLLFVVLTISTGFLWRSGFVAALFALHPQHVESVAWISERKDVLSTLLLMLTLLAYCFYARKPDCRRYTVVLVAFGFGLTAKSMLVSVPLLLLLFDFWPLQRVGPASSNSGYPRFRIARILLEKLPLAILASGSSFITILAQRSGGTVTSSDVIALGSRAANAIMSYGIYIAKTFWPVGLACYYPYSFTGPNFAFIPVLLILVAVTLLALLYAKRFPYFAMGWFWYGISLVPVIGLVQVGIQARADRYTYIPLIGIFVIIAFGIPDLIRLRTKSPEMTKGLAGAGLLALTALGIISYRQVSYWEDSLKLYSHALSVTNENWFAHNGIGVVLRQEAEKLADSGDRQGATSKYREAKRHFEETTRILPQYADAHNSLATCLNALGNSELALAELRKAVSIDPHHVLAYNNLGNLLLRQGKPEEAIRYYREAIRLQPDFAGAHYNLAIALTYERRLDEAEKEYRTVLALHPEPYFGYWSRNKLAVLMQLKGRNSEAIRLLEEAVRLNEATGIDSASDAARKNLALFRGLGVR